MSEERIVNNPVKFEDIKLSDFRKYIIQLGNEKKNYMMIDNTKKMLQEEKTFKELKICFEWIERYRKVKENGLPF